MNLMINGLGEHTSPSLGGFNADLSYNATILSVVSVAFGSKLDLGMLGSIQSLDLSAPGEIHLDELSLESALELNTAQPGSFALAVLTFTGIQEGIGAVFITGGDLSDETSLVSLPFTTSNGEIQVREPARVPDSGSTALLLFLGIVNLSALRKRSHPIGLGTRAVVDKVLRP